MATLLVSLVQTKPIPIATPNCRLDHIQPLCAQIATGEFLILIRIAAYVLILDNAGGTATRAALIVGAAEAAPGLRAATR